jgi:hypothetical protein
MLHVPLALILLFVACSSASRGEWNDSEPSPISGSRSRIAGQAWSAPSCAFGDPACESAYFTLHAEISIVGARSYEVETSASTGNFSIDVDPGEYQVSARSLDDTKVTCPDSLQLSAPSGFVVPVTLVCVAPD